MKNTYSKKNIKQKDAKSKIISSNQAKYNTKNPIKKWLINKLIKKIISLIKTDLPEVVLDAGCGEGYMIDYISRALNCEIIGVDINSESIEYAQTIHKGNNKVKLINGDIKDLPFDDNKFDLVICSEVLEHLDEPIYCLNELRRVSRSRAIISVPNEPYFRLSNLLALNHLKSLGNAPGHINNYNKARLDKLIKLYFSDYRFYYSFPWIIVYGTLAEN